MGQPHFVKRIVLLQQMKGTVHYQFSPLIHAVPFFVGNGETAHVQMCRRNDDEIEQVEIFFRK
jgi:hypothetical protein